MKATYLLHLSDVLFKDVGPEVALEVGQLRGGLQVVLERLLVDVLVVEDDALDDALVQHLLVPVLQPLWLRDFLVLQDGLSGQLLISMYFIPHCVYDEVV